MRGRNIGITLLGIWLLATGLLPLLRLQLPNSALLLNLLAAAAGILILLNR